MKFSILAFALGLVAFNSVGVSADINATSWEEFEVLDEIIAVNATDISEETAAALDAGLAVCALDVKNHGKFVSCAKKFLKQFDKENDLGEDYAIIKKAIAKSDVGKSAVDLIEEETGIDLSVTEAAALEQCEKKAQSLVAYKKCLAKKLRQIVKKGGLKPKEAKKIKDAVKNNDQIEDEIEEEIEDEQD